MIQYCVGFVFSKDKQGLLLIEKNRPEWQKGRLNGIGGLVEENEYPIEAMARECKEETGLDIYANDWEHIASLYFEKNKVGVYFYSVFTNLIYDGKTKTDEEVNIFSVDDVLSGQFDILDNLKWLIPVALDPNTPKPLVNR